MNRWVSELRDTFGWPGLSGVVLLALAWAASLWLLAPLEDELARLEERGGRARSAQAAAQQTHIPNGERMRVFEAHFAAARDDTEYLALLYALATTAGLTLRTAHYEEGRPGRLSLHEQSMALPLSGTYPQIRAFVENALDQIPTLALDRIVLRRGRDGQSTVEADVRFALFLAIPP